MQIVYCCAICYLGSMEVESRDQSWHHEAIFSVSLKTGKAKSRPSHRFAFIIDLCTASYFVKFQEN